MGIYNIDKIKANMNNCISFISSRVLDIYTLSFWVFSYMIYDAAILSGVVNKSTTMSKYSEEIFDYRNSYAHNEPEDILRDDLLSAVESLVGIQLSDSFMNEQFQYVLNYDFGGKENDDL